MFQSKYIILLIERRELRDFVICVMHYMYDNAFSSDAHQQ